MTTRAYDDVGNDTVTANVTSPKIDFAESPCSGRHDIKFVFFSLLPVFTVVMNALVLAAVLRSYKRLVRRNHVYVHVISSLVANLVFGVLALIQILCLYYNVGAEAVDPPQNLLGIKKPYITVNHVNKSVKFLWTLYKGLLCAMFLVMSGNIGLLINSIRDSTITQLRLASGYRRRSTNKQKNGKCTPSYSRKAWSIVAVLWLVPAIYVATSLDTYNCSHQCTCLSECYPKSMAKNETDPSCSRVFPPMKNMWLLFTVVTWSFGSFFIFYYLKRSTIIILNIQRQLRGGGELKKASCSQHSRSSGITMATTDACSCDGMSSKSEKRRHSSMTMTKFVTRFKKGKIVTHHLKYVLYLSVAFVVCTAPAMILFLLDIINPGAMLKMIAINLCLCLPFVYCLLCPLILVQCLPGVKSSMSELCFRIYSHTTVAK